MFLYAMRLMPIRVGDDDIRAVNRIEELPVLFAEGVEVELIETLHVLCHAWLGIGCRGSCLLVNRDCYAIAAMPNTAIGRFVCMPVWTSR